MKSPQDISRDIDEIRSIMERSTKFPSLSGLSGVLAGLYAVAGTHYVSSILGFDPQTAAYRSPAEKEVVIAAAVVFAAAVGTAILFTNRKAGKRGERVWNAASRRLLVEMSVPLLAGGLLCVMLLINGLSGLLAPVSMLFYGCALFSAGRYTFDDVRTLGIVMLLLGLIGAFNIPMAVMLWGTGFGAAHILYGIIMHFKYDR